MVGDRLIGVRSVSGDDPQITQITQIKKISHEKAQEAQKENAKGSVRKAPLFATANSSSAEYFRFAVCDVSWANSLICEICEICG
jgi:hypothetical protein